MRKSIFEALNIARQIRTFNLTLSVNILDLSNKEFCEYSVDLLRLASQFKTRLNFINYPPITNVSAEIETDIALDDRGKISSLHGQLFEIALLFEEAIDDINRYILESQKQISSGQNKSGATRKIDTLSSMVAGMAISKYGFNPDNKRNQATNKIREDLSKLGINFDDETILSHIRYGCEMIEPKYLEHLSF